MGARAALAAGVVGLLVAAFAREGAALGWERGVEPAAAGSRLGFWARSLLAHSFATSQRSSSSSFILVFLSQSLITKTL